MSRTRFAVLGAGNGGTAMAADIAARNFPVRLFEALEMTENLKQLARDKTIHIQGDGPVQGRVEMVTGDMKATVDKADVIFIVAPAFAHKPLFERLIPHLTDGQAVILVPGNFGSYLLRHMMKAAGVSPSVSISEVASLPYACRITAYDTVTVYKRKKSLKLATWPACENRSVLELLSQYTDVYTPSESVLEIALDNFNCILHPLPVLLNYGAIDRDPSGFRHYMDGISPLVSEQMVLMDRERIDIGKAYGLSLMSTIDQLKMYYGENDTQTIHDYVNSPETPYRDLVGHSPRSRYLTEDLPYLLTPIYQLGQKAGISAKVFQLAISLASQLHGCDYLADGNNLEALGIADMTVEELLAYTCEAKGEPCHA